MSLTGCTHAAAHQHNVHTACCTFERADRHNQLRSTLHLNVPKPWSGTHDAFCGLAHHPEAHALKAGTARTLTGLSHLLAQACMAPPLDLPTDGLTDPLWLLTSSGRTTLCRRCNMQYHLDPIASRATFGELRARTFTHTARCVMQAQPLSTAVSLVHPPSMPTVYANTSR